MNTISPSNLFSPLTIKNITLPNRLVMSPMALDIASKQGEVTDRIIEHYAACAGMGLLIVEHAYVRRDGRVHPRQLGMHREALMPRLRQLTEAIHKQGAKAGIQISHGGARALLSPSAPSGFCSPHLKRYGAAKARSEIPRQLTGEEMEKLVDHFAEGARRAKAAGFDLIEIHGAHGYLLNQFYSPLTNLRQDEFGGPLEQRLKFPLAVIRAVRKAIGPEMPLFYRLGADDRLEGGTTLEDSINAIPLLVQGGVDCLDLSGGICGYLKTGPEGFFNYLAEAIKPHSPVPVMVTGGIKTMEAASQVISAQIADLAGIGRAWLDDPQWGKKAWEKYRAAGTVLRN